MRQDPSPYIKLNLPRSFSGLLFSVLIALPLCLTAQNAEPIYRSTAPKKALQSWEQALEQYKFNNLSKARELAEQAIAREPNFVDAWLLLGDIHAGTFDDSLALKAFQRGLELDPEYKPAAWLRLATLHTRQTQLPQAIAALEEYMPRVPEERAQSAGEERDRLIRLDLAMKNPVPFDPKNLGPEINSPHAEYLPSLSLDDSTLIFTRRLDGINEDFYISRRSAEGWTPAQNLGPPVNTPLNEGAQHLSADGRSLLFTMCNQPDGLGSCDLYESIFQGEEGWSAARNLGPSVNSPHWDSQPCLSADGLNLYFASNRPGGLGERDLWKSTRQARAPGGESTPQPRYTEWSSPVNLGPVINSAGIDQAPFLHPDGATLYFTSDGHGSLGGTDLYLSRLGLDGNWGPPENLGFPINTAENEGSLSVSANGRTAWFASDRSEGYGLLDLYTFELPEHLRAAPVTYVKARVRDAISGQPLMAAVELARLDGEELLSRSVTEAGTGTFFAVLPSGHDYLLNVLRKDYLFYSGHFHLPAGRAAEPFVLEIELQPIVAGVESVLRNVFFASGSAALDQRSERELQQLFRLLKEQPSLRILIGGHTDDVGSAADNSVLSDARAKAVRDYLINAGISASRLQHRGYGEDKPVVPNDSEANRALNRRTTVEVLE